MDVVTNISPTDTPMFSSFRQVPAHGRYVEWTTDTLADAAANKQIEGLDYTFSRVGVKTRTGGYTQIFHKLIEISGTQEVVDKTGQESEMAYQTQKKLKEMARDVEYALINETGNSGASGTARALTGVLKWISTTITTGSGTGTQALTETLYNDTLQSIYAQGGNPDTTYANSFQKRQISAFTGGSTKNVNAGDKKLIASVDVYESDFGLQTIKLDRYMTTSIIALLQNDMWEIAVLRPIKVQDVAKIGDAERKAIVGELTLVSRNEAASGQITELTTS